MTLLSGQGTGYEKAIFLFSLIVLTGVAIQHADGGSAVATDTQGNMATAYGGPVQREKQRALALAQRRYGSHVRLLAVSSNTGYGAIAVARQPSGHGSLVGIALGRRSATEADTLAIQQCVKAGGKHPQVRWGFWG